MVLIDPVGAIIGAHFSALIDEYDHTPPGNYGYESARSCLFALLVAKGCSTVHVPNYICSAVRQAVNAAGCIAQTYEIDSDFHGRNIEIKHGELLILANYFGLCARAIEEQLASLPRDAVIVDNSQAYFQAPLDVLATLYSPRKFLPVPDGGFVHTSAELRCDVADEAAAALRMGYLLRRVGAPPEFTRAEYLASEKSLETPSCAAMSALTRNWIRAQNKEVIKARRRANFEILLNRFSDNRLKFNLGDQVPLCFPLRVKNSLALQRVLAAERIYCPRYWPEVEPANEFERSLIEETIFLPIDHRYTINDMHHLADRVSDIEGKMTHEYCR